MLFGPIRMCGVAGYLAAGSPPDEKAVRRMNAALTHRGPDAEGVWQKGRAVLGHRRLSIIDLSPTATQPLLNEDRTIGCVVNGEIYNFAVLRERLIAQGHTFRSRSDSEVVLHLYEQHGTSFVAMLDGMFALALWDSKAERLLLARDRSGKKPLFYRVMADGGIAFASELQALRAGFPELPATVDLGAIDEFLTLQYVPSPRTIYREIAKLDAAHTLVVERGKPPVVERFWAKDNGPELKGSQEELARELRRLLEAAVSRRLISDVPLGAFLSGGLDSSVVVALMAMQSTRAVKTFSIGFPDAADSELPWARMMSKRYQTDHHEVVVTSDIESLVPVVVRSYGEPFADSSAVANYCLAQMTRRHVTVALSGDAADESFGGYTRYQTARLAHLYDVLPRPIGGVYRSAAHAISRAVAPHVSGFFDHFADGEAVRYPYIMCQFTPEEKRQLYQPAMRAAITDATTARFAKILGASKRSPLGRLLDLDWYTYLADDINVKVDTASMAHSLEVRCPFLDTAVVEFASRLPSHLLLRTQGKYLLRRAVAGLLPDPILSRKKRGFALPLNRWMNDDLAVMARDVLLDRRARERGLFDPAAVARLVGGLGLGRKFGRAAAAPDRVWTLLILELWFREFVDKPFASA